jgi:HAD superfamily hydrolase (TIGR01509 family)
MIRAVGFDFDGTLIMSEPEKVKAMVSVFKEEFNISRGVKKAYMALVGNGIIRDQKVEKLFLQFIGRGPTKKERKKVSEHFGKHYMKNMDTCPLFQCLTLIKELKEQTDVLFLLSLENKKEVKKIAKHCNVAKYFDIILGGPTSKVDNFNYVLQKYNIRSSEVLYIGDAHSDVIAAKKKGMKVVLLGKKHMYEKLKEDLEADFVFSSLCEVPYGIIGGRKK